MEVNRREFLKIAGASTIVGILGGWSAVELLAPGELDNRHRANPQALTAKRWAMVVDMRKMDEATMRDCIEACHRVHNVPDIDDPRSEVKWIWLEPFEHAFPLQNHEHTADPLKEQSFLVFCNHCDNPPCVRVCPTKATWKRDDGIVMMDQHRCIGCRYCMAACPYGSRNYNWKDPRPFIKSRNPDYPTRSNGVVEKCTFCAERLDEGLMPACVEASKGALIFGDLADPASEVREILRSHYTIRRKLSLGTEPSVFYMV
jgi:molybdopterin-containing oxidoreductase family iron-sulfur binding subunit